MPDYTWWMYRGDNEKIYFGKNNDFSIQYDSTTNTLKITDETNGFVVTEYYKG